MAPRTQGRSRGNDSSLLVKKKKRGRSSQRADAFYLLEDVFPESTDICIFGGQSIEHVKNILMSLKAAVGKGQASFEYSYTALFALNTTPPPKGIHHSVLHS